MVSRLASPCALQSAFGSASAFELLFWLASLCELLSAFGSASACELLLAFG